MKFLLITLFSSFLIPISWKTDFKKAEDIAQTEHKFMVLNFSGSDWCGPCIRLHKEIFDSEAFTKYAGDHLILVNADFPRLKKNELSGEQQKKNDQLADVYNKDGVFPLTLLINADGKIVKKWEGFPKESPDEFTNQVKALVDANK